MADDGYLLSGRDVRRMRDALRFIESFRREPNTFRRRQPRGGGLGDGFWARLTANAAAPVNLNWIYSWVAVEKTAIGYGGWTTIDGGLFGTYAVSSGGTLDRGRAYNTLEDMNGASGLVGAGVDVDGLDTDYFTFALKEIPVGAIVWMRPVVCTVAGVDVTEYWFTAGNAVDGECD